MGQFGETLRKERESRGIALEAITSETKIAGRHLLALEQEDFGQLPGGVINKGIVRGYARVVGLDEDAWIGRFLSACQESGAATTADDAWIAFAENVARSHHEEDDAPSPERRLRWAGICVLVTVLSALGWYVWHYVEQRLAQARPPAASTLSYTSQGMASGRPLGG